MYISNFGLFPHSQVDVCFDSTNNTLHILHVYFPPAVLPFVYSSSQVNNVFMRFPSLWGAWGARKNQCGRWLRLFGMNDDTYYLPQRRWTNFFVPLEDFNGKRTPAETISKAEDFPRTLRHSAWKSHELVAHEARV